MFTLACLLTNSDLQVLEDRNGVRSHLLARAVGVDTLHHALLVEEVDHRHARLHVGLEALHQRLGVVVHAARGLAALQATLRHHLLRALQKQDEMQLRITLLMDIHMHLVSDELVPALQILHAAGESVDDNLLLALSFVEADLLQKQINRDFTRNNQPLLDVVVDELSVLASTTTERLEKCLPLLLLAETVSSADGDPAKLLLQSGGHGSLS